MAHNGTANLLGDRTIPTGVNCNLPDALYNDRDVTYVAKREMPIHRLIIFLAAQGKSNKDIAERVGKNEATVSKILRQPWAREKLLAFQREHAEEDIRAILKDAATPALKRVIEISQSREVEPQIALAASRDIVDRFLGKATQPILTETKKSQDLTDGELAARIKEAEQEVEAKKN